MFKIIIRMIAFFSVSLSVSVHSAPLFDPIDPTMMEFESSTPINGTLDFLVYTHPIGTPGSNKYVRPDAPAGYPFKTGLIVPHVPPGNASLRVVEHFDGYTAAPFPILPNNDFSAPGFIVVKTHPGHYPNLFDYYNEYGIAPLDWGGFAKGDSNRWRFGIAFGKINELMSSSVDWNAGLRLEGISYGGTTSILQSLLLKDPVAQSSVTIVNVALPNTLFVRLDTTPNDNINQNGMYYRDAASVQLAWDEPTNVATADIIAQAASLKGKYYSVFGNSGDTTVKFDLEFFTLFCEARKIACMGAWINGDHGQYDPGVVRNQDRSLAVGLPVYMDAGSGGTHGPFSGPDSDSRLDKVLPVFTGSTANFFSIVQGQPGFIRGHYNLGLEWNSVTQPTPTASKLTLPIRYRRHTGFGTGSVYASGDVSGPDTNAANWIPDQPNSATFNITLQRTGKFELPVGKVINYTLPAQGAIPVQSGTATVADAGEITITNLTLHSSDAYSSLELSATPPGC
jgi:hypothetical protein